MTLNSEGLEKAVRAYDDALNNPVFVECKKCQGTGYHHGFGETGHDPDWCLKCGGSQCVLANGEDTRPLRSAISAYLSALPPVDGLEVVAHAYVVEGECEQIEWGSDVLLPDDPSLVELTPLSQASSVIEGLTAEIDDLRDEWQAEYDARLAANTARRAAEARISSLEEENERLREALRRSMEALQAAEEQDNRARFRANSPRGDAEVIHLRSSAIRAVRQALEDHNG